MSLGIAGLLQNRQISHVNGNKCTMQQLPFHALNAMDISQLPYLN